MADDKITWTPEADDAVKQQVPAFARKRAKQGAEEYARQQGQSVMTLELWNEARAKAGRSG